MSDSHTAQRIVVVGAGISGLGVSVALASAGFPVTVLEAGQIGSAASTRNQGWLHSGGVFALQNVELARRCHESLEKTLRFCRDCLDPQQESMVYLIAKPETGTTRATQAWKQAGIPFTEYPLERVFQQLPGLARSEVQHAFQLPDRAFRIDVLLEHLAAAAKNSGVEIRTDTYVARLLQDGKGVRGVVTGAGEELLARLVVLAANVEGAPLYPGVGTIEPGRQSEYTPVALKSHLLALKPGIGSLPFCVLDVDGFNHVPHGATSVFGSNRWLSGAKWNDEHPQPEELERLWRCLQRFFPGVKREEHEVVEWAGTTVQVMHLDQIDPGADPLPTVIDHGRESPTIENLLSIFPGRASLWTVIADEVRRLVLDRFPSTMPPVATPPWA